MESRFFSASSPALDHEVERLNDDNSRLRQVNDRLKRMLQEKDKKIPLYESALERLQRKYSEALSRIEEEKKRSKRCVSLLTPSSLCCN